MSNDRYGPWKVAVKDISTQRGQVAVDFKQRYQPKLVRETGRLLSLPASAKQT
jgi:hypothetical protein